MPNTIVIPSNTVDIKKIKDAGREYSDAQGRMEAERDLQKEILENLTEEVDIPKPVLKKIFDLYAKDSFDKVSQSHEDVEALYETVFRTNP